MDQTELKKLAQNLHLMVLPCTLWAIHIDPKLNFIAIIHIDINYSKLNIDKGILVTSDNNQIKTSVYINNSLISLPDTSEIKVVSDLAHLIYMIHDLKACINSDKNYGFPKCMKYVRSFSNTCSSCIAENKINDSDCRDRESIFGNAGPNVNIDIINDKKLVNNDPQFDNTALAIKLQNPGNENENFIKATDDNNVVISEYENENSDSAYLQCCYGAVEDFDVKDDKKAQYETITCDYCQKVFSNKTQLKEHTKSHTGEKRYICTICNKTSTQKSSHKRHMLIHSGIKPNLCNVCGKTFCFGYRMEDHMLIHTKERPFECKVCRKTFSKNYNLKLHEKTHTGERPYVCSTCGKTYTTKSNLRTHIMSTHSNNKPHSCTSCSMSFVHPRLLKIHMRKHTGEKPFKCTICGKAFPKKIHLTIHTRFHTGEKPHICSMCGRGFTTTGNLNSHKKVHHKELK